MVLSMIQFSLKDGYNVFLDEEDSHFLTEFKWRLDPWGYAQVNITKI